MYIFASSRCCAAGFPHIRTLYIQQLDMEINQLEILRPVGK